MANLDQLLKEKTAKTVKPSNGASLGIFESPVNGEKIELIVLFRGNKKIGDDFIQLSVLPVNGDIKDRSIGRNAICGSCPHNKIGSCYAVDQGLFVMMREYKNGNYKKLDFNVFLSMVKGYNVRFGRFGDLSLLPFDVVNSIAKNAKGFTGYSNQWRSKFYDPRFNEIFMLSTMGEKDSKKAFSLFPDARQFKVIKAEQDYKEDIKTGFITCPSDKGFNCNECLLCDGKQGDKAIYNIEIKAHGLDFKTKRINKLLKNDK